MANESFEDAFRVWLAFEGPESDDPDDPGGLTRYGIAQRFHPDVDVASLTEAEAKEILRRKYWDANRLDLIRPKNIAIKLFSLGAGPLGMRRAIQLLQRACNDLGAQLDDDGIMGSNTALFINRYRHPEAVEEAFEARVTSYLTTQKKGSKFLAGWLRRVDA